MAARITRAKKKITQARIPYRVPDPEELPARVDAVLAVLHLLFTTGHTAPSGDQLVRHDLVVRALDLTRMLHSLLPTPEVTGLLALIVLTDARRATRVDGDGRLLLLEEQDRSRWDRLAVTEGVALVREALQQGSPGRYALQAAIAAVHADAVTWDETDWREIVALYALLERRWPSPVVALNRAVAVGMLDGPASGLDALDALGSEPALASYAYFPAARADFLRRLGRTAQARTAYEEALLLTENTVERRFLAGRLSGLDADPA
jgi:RNA polymerase sigma-70 factor (ECF subfamily)